MVFEKFFVHGVEGDEVVGSCERGVLVFLGRKRHPDGRDGCDVIVRGRSLRSSIIHEDRELMRKKVVEGWILTL